MTSKNDYTQVHFQNNGKLKLLILVGTRPEIIRLSAVITNFIGNLVVGLMFVPIVVAFATSASISQNLVVAIAITTNMSLFMPSGSPLAALLHSNTEWCSTKDIYKYSWPIVLVGVLVCFVTCLTLGNIVF